ncbi:hypothetical protein ABL78_3448 [Leptomonas seymouri]|uniref:Uncharacterized protein n=1 Tax=Leptomonas seymouri TaxID=5684 RepID=A0A0N0P6C3_LEPSE|nr:hypothetical protein ABL78_3448 [Leptomonas seymouri]|eukprot:KPI87459.1 hypothetical protein ABL78_3448 [Leptomonas seymouri]
MLKRHGTRLDIGTAEDIAELNAAEALLRASYKPTPMSTGGSSGGARVYSTAGSIGHVGSGIAGFNPRGAASYNMLGAMGRSSAADIASGAYYPTAGATGNVSQGGSSAAIARNSYDPAGTAAPPPPHVHLGHSIGRASSAATGIGAPTPASSATSSIHAQRALYRNSGASAGGSDTMSPSGRISTATAATGYASSSGRTPGSGMMSSGTAAMRGTAQPLFHALPGGDDHENSVEVGAEEEFHGRPSMMRAPFAVPVPVRAAVGSPGDPTRLPTYMQPASPVRRGGPSAASLPPPQRYGRRARMGEGMRGEGSDEDEEDEGRAARPSRVSGRYQLPRSPSHGDSSSS